MKGSTESLNPKIHSQLNNLVVLYLIALAYGTFTIWYRTKYLKNHEDFFMNKNIIKTCNGWCIGHIIHYIFIGYFAPNLIIPALILGAAFEVVEIYLDKISNGIVKGYVVRDTMYNSFGAIIGYALFKKYPHKFDISKKLFH